MIEHLHAHTVHSKRRSAADGHAVGTWVGKFQGLLGLDDVVPVLLEAAKFTLKDGQLAHGVVWSDLTLRQVEAK